MLTREEVAEWSAELGAGYADHPEALGLCTMANALLTIVDIVPGDGDIVERINAWNDVYRMLTDELRELRLASARAEHAARQAAWVDVRERLPELTSVAFRPMSEVVAVLLEEHETPQLARYTSIGWSKSHVMYWLPLPTDPRQP